MSFGSVRQSRGPNCNTSGEVWYLHSFSLPLSLQEMSLSSKNVLFHQVWWKYHTFSIVWSNTLQCKGTLVPLRWILCTVVLCSTTDVKQTQYLDKHSLSLEVNDIKEANVSIFTMHFLVCLDIPIELDIKGTCQTRQFRET